VRDDVHAPYAQGYLMHRPMPLASMLETIRADRADRAGPRSATFDGEPQDGPDVELTPTG
jgi:hypothetical protein